MPAFGCKWATCALTHAHEHTWGPLNGAFWLIRLIPLLLNLQVLSAIIRCDRRGLAVRAAGDD